MIDTQLHIIDPDRFPFPAQSRGYLPGPEEGGDAPTLVAVLDSHGMAKGVLVQASVYGTDNAAILAAAEASPGRFKVVAMAEAGALDRLAQHPSVAGIRLNLTDFADHSDMGAARRLAAQVFDRDLVLQVQAVPEALTTLLADLPSGKVIIDHFGRPDLLSDRDLGAVRRLADREGSLLKVSGVFRLAGRASPGSGRPDPRLVGLVKAFGADRVLWGSDWPFLNTSGNRPDYAACLAEGQALIDMDRAAATAKQVFGWDDG